MKTLKNFDQVLEDALAEYRDAEPLAGLEDRVLQRLRSAPKQRPFWKWSPVLTVALAIVAFAVVIGLRDHERQQPVQTQAIRKVPAIAAPPVAKAPTVSAHTRSTHPTHRDRSAQPQQATLKIAPGNDQFPTPQPLTPEERTLLALAATHPQALIRPRSDDQLSIPPITIKPLDTDDGGKGEQP